MKSTEKQLVGVAILAAGIYVVFSFGLPQWDAFSTNNAKSATLQSDLKAAQSEKDSLALQISLLEKNIDIPAGIQVKTFTNDTEEQAAKELLDHVVNLATHSGNKFVSLSPAKVDPFLVPKPAAKPANGTDPSAPPLATPTDAAAAVTPAPADGAPSFAPGSEEEKAAALAKAQDSLPSLVTKGYELTVRGTYSSLQAFLRAMDAQSMVMDMMSFDLENEAAGVNDGAAAAGTTTMDPNFPLRLKVTLRLALQRIESTK